ncbi:hypothetical protein F5X99DRAFT_411681 [Biscogniauxia marginata]|nr:hypothetical protein F5X99DRAFT_411681 [Biscogniauxia marginata]
MKTESTFTTGVIILAAAVAAATRSRSAISRPPPLPPLPPPPPPPPPASASDSPSVSFADSIPTSVPTESTAAAAPGDDSRQLLWCPDCFARGATCPASSHHHHRHYVLSSRDEEEEGEFGASGAIEGNALLGEDEEKYHTSPGTSPPNLIPLPLIAPDPHPQCPARPPRRRRPRSGVP